MNTAISRIEHLIEASKDPEYRFLLLEPILSYGIAFGILFFIAGFFIRHSRVQLAALAVTGASALVFMPYISARRDALPRIEQIYRFSQASRGKMFTENTALWSASTWIYTGVLFLSAATIIVGSRRNQLGYGLSLATVLMGMYAIQNSLWMHYLDASAVHPNLSAHQAPMKSRSSDHEKSSKPPPHRIPNTTQPRETHYSGPVDEGLHSPPRPRTIRPIQ